jgi:hypothetical protein
MKISPILSCCGALTVASAIAVIAIVLRSNAQSDNLLSADNQAIIVPPAPDDQAGVPSGPLLNTETWELIGLDGKPLEGEANSQEAIDLRFYDNLAAVNPEEYERIFPKTPEMRAAIDKAMNDVLQPRTLEEHLSEIKNPETLAEIEKSIDGILNPRQLSDDEIKHFQDSPAGPWSNIIPQ